MIIYTANPNTGEYEGNSVATVDPVATKKANTNIYTLPAHSTFEAPPPLNESEVAVLVDGSWETVKDYRGTKLYSHSTKESFVISELGPIPFGYTEDAPGEYDSWGANVWVTDEEAQLAGMKVAKLYKLRDIADSILESATSDYPSMEKASWPKQEEQARIWLSASEDATPLLDGIALARDITKDELAAKILTKAGEFEVLAGLVVGKRQAIETSIEQASTVEEVDLINLTII